MTEKVTLKALFFDVNGVLVDTSRSYLRAIEETVEHFTGRAVLPGTIQRYRNVGAGGDDASLTHTIITDTGMTVAPGRVVEEFQRRYRGESWNGFICEEPPLVDTRLLDRLCAKGRILGIVTARPNAEVRSTLERFGWKRYFPLVVPREKQDERLAPDPYALQHALLILEAVGRRIQPGEAAYVGGTAAGMAAARAAGLWAIGFAPGTAADRDDAALRLRRHGAHAVIGDMADLPALVDRPGSPAPAVPALEREAEA